MAPKRGNDEWLGGLRVPRFEWTEIWPRYQLAEPFVRGRSVLELGTHDTRGLIQLVQAGAGRVVAATAAPDEVEGPVDVVEVVSRSPGVIDFPNQAFEVLLVADLAQEISANDRFFDEVRRIVAEDGVLVLGFAGDGQGIGSLFGAQSRRTVPASELIPLIRKHYPTATFLRQTPFVGLALTPDESDLEVDWSPDTQPLKESPSYIVASVAPTPLLSRPRMVELPFDELDKDSARQRTYQRDAVERLLTALRGARDLIGAQEASLREIRARLPRVREMVDARLGSPVPELPDSSVKASVSAVPVSSDDCRVQTLTEQLKTLQQALDLQTQKRTEAERALSDVEAEMAEQRRIEEGQISLGLEAESHLAQERQARRKAEDRLTQVESELLDAQRQIVSAEQALVRVETSVTQTATAGFEREIQRLSDALDSSEQARSEVCARLVELEQKHQAISSDRQVLTRQNMQLRQKLETHQDLSRRSEHSTDGLRQELAQATQSVEAMRRTLEVREQELDRAKAHHIAQGRQQKAVELSAQHLAKEVERYRSRIIHLHEERDTLATTSQMLLAERDHARLSLIEAEERLKAYAMSLTAAERAEERTNEDLIRLSSELEAAQLRRIALEDQLSISEGRCVDLSNRCERTQAELSDMRGQLSELNERLLHKEQLGESQRQRVQAAEARSDSDAEQLVEALRMVAETHRDRARLLRRIDQLEEAATGHETAVEAALAQQAKLEAQLVDKKWHEIEAIGQAALEFSSSVELQSRYTFLETLMTETLESHELLEEELTDAQARLGVVDVECSRLASALEENQDRLSLSTKECFRMSEALSHAQQQAQVEKLRVSALEAQLGLTSGDLTELEAALSEAKSALASERAQAFAYKAQVDDLRTHLQEEQHKTEQLLHDKQSARADAMWARLELEDVRNQGTVRMRDGASQVVVAEAKPSSSSLGRLDIVSLETKLEEARQELLALKSSISNRESETQAQLRAELEDTQIKLDGSRITQSELSEQLMCLRIELDEAHQEVRFLRSSWSPPSAAPHAEAVFERVALEEARADFSRLREVNSAHEVEDTALLRHQLEEARADLSRLREVNSAHEVEDTALLRHQLEEARADLSRLREVNSAHEGQDAVESRAFEEVRAELVNLRELNTTHEDQNAALLGELEEARMELTRLQEQNLAPTEKDSDAYRKLQEVRTKLESTERAHTSSLDALVGLRLKLQETEHELSLLRSNKHYFAAREYRWTPKCDVPSEDERSVYEVRLAAAQLRAETAEAQVQELTGRVDRQCEALSRLRSHEDRYRLHNMERDRAMETLEDRLAAGRDMVFKVRAQLNETETHLRDSEQEKQVLQHQIEALKKTLRKAQEELRKRQIEVSQLHDEIVRAQVMAPEVEALAEPIQASPEGADSPRSTGAVSGPTLSIFSDEDMDVLRTRIEDMSSLLQKADRDRAQLEASHKYSERESQRLRTEIAGYEQAIRRSHLRVSSLEAELALVRSDVFPDAEVPGPIEHVTDTELKKLEAAIADVDDTNLRIETLQAALNEAEAQVQELSSDLNTKPEQMEALARQVEALSAQLEASESQLKRVEAAREASHQEARSALERAAEAEQRAVIHTRREQELLNRLREYESNPSE